MRDLIPQGGLDPQYRPGYHAIDDVPVGGILGFAVGLVAFTAISAAALALVMRLAQVGEDVEQARRPALFSDNTGLYAQAGPDVYKENPIYDNADELAAEARSLEQYTWIDPQNKQQARIPLDRAIDILARRGLPRSEAADDSAEINPNDAIRRARVNARPIVPLDRTNPAAAPPTLDTRTPADTGSEK